MVHKVTLIPGDGIGPEITEAAVRVIEAAGVEIAWDRQEAGIPAVQTHGTSVPDQLLDSIHANKVALKGPITTLVGKGFRSANVTLRQRLDLYVNLRPVRTIGGVPSRYSKVNLVIVRENTEDLYSGIENMITPGVTQAIKVVTERASERVARWAFNYARKMGRKKITFVHKANIMKLSDGLFLKVFEDVAKDYPDIEAEDRIVDALCMRLVMDPTQFDMLLMGNLFGDIVSDLAAGLVGGLGVVPGANIGDEYAVFEAVHGSAPDIAGKNLANPTALIFSALLMLRHLGEDAAADRIWKSMVVTLAEGHKLTRDLGGTCSTTEFTDELVREIKSRT
ncbi:MAG TPA: isocitrate/isopropylmalate dehydrogenase family protein [candidate division Zixibacteria bacterium]|nr:isocitrate/isopropylmalate dehydrogenase family protein [candidate division Zixibacteria bacterium]MDD4918341.1 isocitrate/isopropylmalate dehydrogenase family protein [candidate division Zixibacteria bacterium]MDM7973768.1 isocitrate/isopropylmalate dehydrogenase family protein [candidate division Zixibacteria bacterium]HOD67769.1 isocitrate/isopropylmalate dehydrogenase family protein [candidate division Zixibacteria bacterium]HOZ07655.1 isocitrate/isopropylmalate dehydrogenase family prot